MRETNRCWIAFNNVGSHSLVSGRGLTDAPGFGPRSQSCGTEVEPIAADARAVADLTGDQEPPRTALPRRRVSAARRTARAQGYGTVTVLQSMLVRVSGLESGL